MHFIEMITCHVFIVFKYVILILRKEKHILGRIDLYFGGCGEKLVCFYGFGEQRQNTFREPRQLFSGIWGNQCIIFRDQGSTDPPGGLNNEIRVLVANRRTDFSMPCDLDL